MPRRKNARSRRARVARLAAIQGGICILCFRPLVRPTVEHIVPKSRGGAGLRNNVAVSCWKCNNERGNALLTPAQQVFYERLYGPE